MLRLPQAGNSVYMTPWRMYQLAGHKCRMVRAENRTRRENLWDSHDITGAEYI